jgi:hypothetical protein
MKPQRYENHRKFHNLQFAHPAAPASRLPRSASQYISDLSATAAPAHQAVLTLNALEFRACVLECGGCDTTLGWEFPGINSRTKDHRLAQKRRPPKAFGVATALQDLAAVRVVHGEHMVILPV